MTHFQVRPPTQILESYNRLVDPFLYPTQILESYYRMVDPSKADLDLIFYIITLIIECPHPDGSVLVFLPSYDDIIR